MVEIKDQPTKQEASLPEVLPLLPLRGVTAFPGMVIPVVATEEHELKALEHAVSADRLLALFTVRREDDHAAEDNLYEVGVVATVHKMIQMPDDSRRLVLRTIQRVRLARVEADKPFLLVKVEALEDEEDDPAETDAQFHALLRKFGRIVNISSINGQKGQMGQVNYSAAKAGVIGFTKALALENARKGVTVNCICPGYIDTEMVQAVPEKVLESIISQIPVGRLGKAAEIASLVAWLASDDAAFMTGAVLTINGGQYIANG